MYRALFVEADDLLPGADHPQLVPGDVLGQGEVPAVLDVLAEAVVGLLQKSAKKSFFL